MTERKTYPISKDNKYDCEVCGKHFHRMPSASKFNKHHFCSSECYDKWRDEGNLKGIHTKERVETKCSNCGNVLMVYPYKLKNNKNVFCNDKCLKEFKSKSIIDCKCDNCGSIFQKLLSSIKRTQHNFCSNECCIKWYVDHPESRTPRKQRVPLTKKFNCYWCNNPSERRRGSHSSDDLNHFCSRKCFTQYLAYILSDGYKSADDEEGFTRKILWEKYKYKIWRNEVLKRDNYKCIICGSRVKVQAHHLTPVFKIRNHHNIQTRKDIDNCNELFDVNNGICLCKDHHVDFHKKYGNRRCCKEDFFEYQKQAI